MEEFIKHSERMGKRVNPLLRSFVEGGLGYHTLLFLRDTQHCLDLGVSHAISGSVLWLLSFGEYICAYPNDAIHTLKGLLDELYYRERPASRYTNLELNQFTVAARTHLSHQFLKDKAADARRLVPYLRVI